MKYIRGTGLGVPILRNMPVYAAAADMPEGCGLIRGTTAETDLGCAILATGACADFIGLLKTPVDYSEDGDSDVTAGTLKYKKVEINPLAIIEAEYDQSDSVTGGSSSSTTLTLASLEDNIDTGFILSLSGDSKGQLQYIATSASGSCTTKTAFDSAVASGDTLIKILPVLHPLVKLNAAATKIGTDAAAGSAVVTVLANKITNKYIAYQDLTPDLSGKKNMIDNKTTVYAHIIFRNHALNSID